MKLGRLWQDFGGNDGVPASREFDNLFIFGVTDDTRDVRFGFLF